MVSPTLPVTVRVSSLTPYATVHNAIIARRTAQTTCQPTRSFATLPPALHDTQTVVAANATRVTVTVVHHVPSMTYSNPYK